MSYTFTSIFIQFDEMRGYTFMVVRSFRLSDYQPVAALMESVLSQACCEETREAFARQLGWDSDLILVAEIEGEIAGFIIGTIDRNRGYYYRIAVHPDYRGRGCAKALIQGLKVRFEQRKVTRVMVAADEHNKPILPLYEAMGYEAQDFQHSNRKLAIMAV